MKKELLLELTRKYLKSKMLLGAIFLLVVCAVFLYVILGSNMFLVSVDGHDRAVITVRADAQGIIDICGVELAEGDVVEFNNAGSEAGTLVVRRAFDVTVTADGVSKGISVIEGTVRDAIEACGVELDEYDEVTPSLDTHLFGDMEIHISRIKYVTRSVEESIPYASKQYRSIYHIRRTRTVTQKGENGIKTTTYRDKYVDGVLESSTLVSVSTTKMPVDELTAVGTSTQLLLEKHAQLAVLRQSNTPPTEYSAVYTLEGTAYTYSSIEKYNVTAMGGPVREGAVAIDPTVIPYGTLMYVESLDGRYVYGYCIAEDTGGGIKGNRIDLFYESSTTVYNFGRRQVRVYIVG